MTIDQNIGREWNSPYGRQRIAAVITGGCWNLYSVVSPDGAERRYNATDIESVIHRDEYALTPEYAQEQAELAEMAQLRKENQERAEAKQAKELADIAAFTADLSPMRAGKVRDTLLVRVSRNGVPMTRKAMIEQAVAEGYKVLKTKDGRELTSPDGSFLSESTVTKAGMDYAIYLLDK